MSRFALTMMQVGLLVLLYLFVWRAVRSVGRGIRAPATGGPVAAPAKAASKQRKRPKREARGGAPSTISIVSQQGKRIGNFHLVDPTEIGRADNCSIRLTDTYASQMHARLSQRNGAWIVEDLGSTNGTFLNERELESPSEVRAGDRIRIGTTILELRA
jgi:hypothetical protein